MKPKIQGHCLRISLMVNESAPEVTMKHETKPEGTAKMVLLVEENFEDGSVKRARASTTATFHLLAKQNCCLVQQMIRILQTWTWRIGHDSTGILDLSFDEDKITVAPHTAMCTPILLLCYAHPIHTK
ncbi:nuclear RNA export factor 1 [Striga asiatica]|uniref:Nuclear RNA export factor 1 n=1 Tax=Striga asiatica TaxID=4170 RepID=A0A5A7PV39_STRAF|nr:nuclear RNA export factor 1 [Striga asiatica]